MPKFMSYWFIGKMAITWRKTIRLSLPKWCIELCLIKKGFLRLVGSALYISNDWWKGSTEVTKITFRNKNSLSCPQTTAQRRQLSVVFRLNYNRFSSLFISPARSFRELCLRTAVSKFNLVTPSLAATSMKKTFALFIIYSGAKE